ncbi:hypothetical protein GCM10010319_61750 [Streptomyces blastmyceticus]|uniref:Uncharacterized protein n=1 Tax=Streptomyces blastmyceticus TaxID=68180 RepID=A0ABP3HNH1_9ACTN
MKLQAAIPSQQRTFTVRCPTTRCSGRGTCDRPRGWTTSTRVPWPSRFRRPTRLGCNLTA